MRHIKDGFISGLMWNFISIIFLALGGLIFNVIIIAFYDAEILGVFNQVFAYYTLLSQFAVFGIQASITKYTSDHWNNKLTSSSLYLSAMAAVIGTSFLVSLLTFIVMSFMEQYMDSKILDGIRTVLPGLIFFSMNKVSLGYLNGLSHMKAYAVFQSLRNVTIALILMLFARFHVDGILLPLCFTISEFLLFLLIAIYMQSSDLIKGKLQRTYMKQHLHFGFLILPGNLILEFNAKIDVITLGWILADNKLIGYYSFASLFAEGFYQLFVVVRRSINPLIARSYNEGKFETSFIQLKRKIQKYTSLLSLPGVLCLILGFATICYLLNAREYLTALLPLVVISLSIALNSRYIILGNLLSQLGFPAQESIVNLCSAACNLLLNLIFIHLWGLMGAAVATAISYFTFSAILNYYAHRRLYLDF